ncbi:DNA-binding protein [Candidatus Parcubacteria bacterium]|nr:MAG: DNA-binding protein [Candidatus Parcubacteria bacterium]
MDEILTIKEVAAYLKVSRTTVWRWCREGKLPAFRVGRGWRIHRAVVEQITRQYADEEAQPKKLARRKRGSPFREDDDSEEVDYTL